MLFTTRIIIQLLSFSIMILHANAAPVMVPLMAEISTSVGSPPPPSDEPRSTCSLALFNYLEGDQEANVTPASYLSCLSLVEQLRGVPLTTVPEGENRVCDAFQADNRLHCCVGWTNEGVEGVRYGDLVNPVTLVLRNGAVSHDYQRSGAIFDSYELAGQCTSVWVGVSM